MFVASVVITILLLAGIPCVVAAGGRLSITTLRSAHRWSVVAVIVWGIAWAVEFTANGAPPEWGHALWYAAAVLALCPPMAVLGARRPGVRVWSWFVLAPLIAVLVLPVLGPVILATKSWEFRVPVPLMLGFAVVLLMGVGNYVGTRYALSSGLLGMAVILVVAPLSDAAAALTTQAGSLRIWGSACFAAAILWGRWQSSRPMRAADPLDVLWFDYRDTFGIVWGRRIQERINQRAVAENWNWRLADRGFVPVDARVSVTAPDTDPRIEQALRWLLRRFVDPQWIDRRLGAGTSVPPN